MLVKYELPREPDERGPALFKIMGNLGFPRAVLCNGLPVEIPEYYTMEPLGIFGFLLDFPPEKCIELELDDPFEHHASFGDLLLAA